MSNHTRIEVALKMKESGVIPVFYHPEINVCKQVLKACFDGGLRAFEFTNRGDFAHETFAELSKFAKADLPELALGAGSIIEPGTTSLYIQLGADFIVSPILNPEMAKICNRRKILWSPGCGSLSEISFAEELGAEIVKIFPGAQVGGYEFVKAVKGPMPWTNIMPTGGVAPDKENLEKWFKSGVYCVGMGSNLFPKEIIASGNYSWIKKKVAEIILLLKDIRKDN
ncbi:MAG: bifunctional 4-hydroxy-2-oxoglutarate aldolase/2-dehydro-3-deoxy-phosphogluconate aldolase [Bacteroidales bacterium]|nr:bifunctional 4-hydroxy-2-oxoglutarate aldolase/2-dehydro-3-deoxy-phosphogluconate aldolase [Bacteroidales bacterium]